MIRSAEPLSHSKSGLAAQVGIAHSFAREAGSRSASCRLAVRGAWVGSGARAFFLNACRQSPVRDSDIFGSSLRIFLRRLAPLMRLRASIVRFRLQASM